jgi:hypothetical protein
MGKLRKNERNDKSDKRVIGKLLSFFLGFVLLSLWVGKLYDAGINRPSLLYRSIPESTLSWVNYENIQDPSQIMTASSVGPYNWDNKKDIGQNKSVGSWDKREDANHIIYYRRDKEALGQSRALLVSNCLDDMMLEIIDLFGHYTSPDSLNGRKLAIYLPNTDEEFDILMNKFSEGRSSFKNKYGCSFIELGPLGCQNKGILLHPKGFVDRNEDNHFKYEKALRREVARYVYFSSLNYNKDISHRHWFVDGVVEYFTLNLDAPFLLDSDKVDLIETKFSLLDDFKVGRNASRWAGASFFFFYAENYGDIEVANLVQKSYNISSDSIFNSLSVAPDTLHLRWVESLKVLLEKNIEDKNEDYSN